MEKAWSITKLTAIGGIATLTVILAMVGGGIAAATGIPGTSGFITTLTSPAMVVFCCLLINRFGSATLMEFIHGLLEIPLPLTGTPGFIFKVPILLSGGLIVDLLFAFFKKKKVTAGIIIGGFYVPYGGLSVIVIGRLFGMSGVEKAAAFLTKPIMLILAAIGGVLGGLLGVLVYNKLKDAAVVKRIQRE